MSETSSGGWDPAWEDLFRNESWGRYPSEHLVGFIGLRLKDVAEVSSIRVLEIGSGSGPQIWFLAREGLDTHGVEGSETGVQITQQRLADESLSGTVTVGDVINLDYPDAHFDYVIDVECLTCMTPEMARSAVVEALRVLKPGGQLFSQTLKAPDDHSDAAQRGRHHERKRYLRKTPEPMILEIYDGFSDLSVDLVTQTRRNRTILIEEWIIVGTK